jgi:hypothetical protein
MENKFECPHCNKTIIESNQKTLSSNDNDLIIKSKLIFLNEDGKVLCKCSCKKIISLPLDFCKSTDKIKENNLTDL